MSDLTQIPAVVNAAGGAIAGVVSNVLLYPLDLVTVRLQVQRKIAASAEGKAASEPDSELYTGIIDAFKRILREEGVAELYDGVVSDSGATMIQAFLYFFAYDFIRNSRLHQIQRRTGKLPRTLSTPEELLSGSVAGVFCKFFTAPINNLVVLKQAATTFEDGQNVRNLSNWDAIREMYKSRGISGFWAGYSATILLSVNPSFTYYFYQTISAKIIPHSRRHHPKPLEIFLAAAIAKSLATLITYPLILVKTRFQAATTSSPSKSLFSVLIDIFKNNGVSGLYAGASGQIIKGFFSQGLTMMTKDRIARGIVYLYLLLRSYNGATALRPNPAYAKFVKVLAPRSPAIKFNN